MADADEITGAGVLRAELRHLDKRVDELEARSDHRLDNHAKRIRSVEDWQLAFKTEFRTERKWLVIIASGVSAAITSVVAGAFYLFSLYLRIKGG